MRKTALTGIIILLGTTTSNSLQANASETLSLPIFASALILLYTDPKKNWQLFLLGTLLGLIPWTKLQGIPLALTIAALAGIPLFWNKQWSKIPLLIIGGLLPSLLIGITVLLLGIQEDFLNRYIVNNLSYTKTTEGILQQPFHLGEPFNLWVFLTLGAMIGLQATSKNSEKKTVDYLGYHSPW